MTTANTLDTNGTGVLPPPPAAAPGGRRKTECPVSRDEFRRDAQPLVVKLGDHATVADVKEFSTGSLGWYVNGKTTIDVGGKKVTVQIGLNLTIVGSKELPAK